MNRRCHACCKTFKTLQECLKHDLLEHSLQNKKINSGFNNLCKAALKFLTTPEKLEERAKVRAGLNHCNAGDELLSIFQILCMDNNNLELQFGRIKACLHSGLKDLGAQLEIHAFGSIVSKLALKGKCNFFLLLRLRLCNDL